MGVYELGIYLYLRRLTSKVWRMARLPVIFLLPFLLWKHAGRTATYILLGVYVAVLYLKIRKELREWDLYKSYAEDILHGNKKSEEKSNSVGKKE